MAETPHSLLQLNTLIKNSVREKFNEQLWVIGEINEINENHSGHCYLELIEKAKNSDQIVARAKCTIWFITWRMLKPYFITATGQEFVPGLKVMVRVSVEFHEVFGFSLNIKDIDPVYTLGDLEQKKAEILRQLESDGIIDLNQSLLLATVPQRIAVISSPTAAGFHDFMHQLENNSHGYKFSIQLFQATMQGMQAEASILKAMDEININSNRFDAVVLIRGGGAKADLNCFNSYLLASHIAQFPLPVITGIGHEKDTTIVDIVAHTRLKTPTAAAVFLISKFEDFESLLTAFENQLSMKSNAQIEMLQDNIAFLVNRFYPTVLGKINLFINKSVSFESRIPELIRNYLVRKKYLCNNSASSLKTITGNILRFKKELNIRSVSILIMQTGHFLEKQSYRLKFKEDTTNLHQIENILRKGFAIVTRNGKIVKSVKDLKKSDIIETKFNDGRTNSIVKSISFSD